MVDWIVRLTAMAVTAVVLADVARGVWLMAKLTRYLRVKYPRLGYTLWLPRFESRRDAAAWLATWRAIARSGDPVIAAIRLDGHAIVLRYFQLALTSNGWAMVVSTIVPRLSA